MGSSDDVSERPIHRVTIKPFAISKFPVTVREWNQCVAAKACSYVATGKDEAPVTNISWDDAQEFVRWLSQVSQKTFRLPSEAEWEYAARGGTQTKYWWGDQPQPDMANCKGCGAAYDLCNLQRLEASKQTRSVSMTWEAVLTNGSRIAGTRTIKVPQATDRRGLTRLLSHGSFDPVLGETTKAMSDRPVAKVTTPLSVPTSWIPRCCTALEEEHHA